MSGSSSVPPDPRSLSAFDFETVSNVAKLSATARAPAVEIEALPKLPLIEPAGVQRGVERAVAVEDVDVARRVGERARHPDGAKDPFAVTFSALV
jgi:hypothetical protein